ncbi:MAG TPA: hypothetical protein VFO79_10325 [Xanthomonadales bacterium]|nr:hypothetical protein [Xanthomonadales bacterium]
MGPMRTTILLAVAMFVVHGATRPAAAATTVYLNRCTGGCVFTPGPDDSTTNMSSIVSGTSNLTGFAHGDAVFDATVACIEGLLRPFDIEVTLVDPSPAAHTELVLAGTPQQAGFPSGTAGVAPFSCGYVAGAPAFVFANLIGPDASGICWVAGSQLGALAGIEPLFNCPDVTSYLTGCGEKSYRNEDSQCGTFSATSCTCGGTTKNSFAIMRAVFGAADLLFGDGFE